jgi:hypothetical protein
MPSAVFRMPIAFLQPPWETILLERFLFQSGGKNPEFSIPDSFLPFVAIRCIF